MRLLEIRPAAQREMRSAIGWYRKRSPNSALRLAAALIKAIQDIESDPLRWPKYLAGTHVFWLKRFPYQVIYRFSDAVLEVIAVVHAKRRTGYWKRRLKKPF